MPAVSVVIPVYNAEEFISETLESVLAQTYKDWEIITVNDGSKDRSLAILKKYKKRLGPRMRIIDQKNAGVSAARNRAIRAARGRYIAFLDHDDLWDPTKLEKQVGLFEKNRKLGLVYSDTCVIDARGKLKRRSLLHGRAYRGDVFHQMLDYNFISMSAVMVTKQALKKVGLFNPKYRTVEEYDLWLRITREFPADLVAEPLERYRVHGGMFSRFVELSAQEELEIVGNWLKKHRTTREFRKKRYARIYFRTGWALYRQGEFKKSVRWFRRAMRKSPSYYKTYIALPFALLRTRLLLKLVYALESRFNFIRF